MRALEGKRFGMIVVGLLFAGGEVHQGQTSPSFSPANPAELMRQVVGNEDKASHDLARFMFRDHKQTSHGTTTSLLVETKDTTADLVIARDDKSLEQQEREKEIANLERFVRNPEALRKKTKQDKDNEERFGRIVQALPDAFLYESAGEEVAGPGLGELGDPLLRLKFKPNPNYVPPSSVEKVLTGVQGEILIDPVRKRIARIEGSLFKDVTFGWGILGHLDRGGHFLLEQGTVSESHWDITRMTMAFTGKILVKRLEIMSDEVFSDYRAVPENLTFAQGIELLKKQPEIQP